MKKTVTIHETFSDGTIEVRRTTQNDTVVIHCSVGFTGTNFQLNLYDAERLLFLLTKALNK